MIRQDQIVVVPVSSIKERYKNFDENFLSVKEKEKILPFDIIKGEDGNSIIFIDNFRPDEQKQITFSFPKTKTSAKVKRTQAYLGIKENYKMKDGVYTEGNFESTKSVTVPKSHFPHDALYQMEGPAWESDKVAYRFYLDERNRTDIFGKTTPKMVLDIIGKNDLLSGNESYENPLWWGGDIFKVGNSLGIGSIAEYLDNKVVTVSQTDSIKCSILNNNVYSSVRSKHFGWNTGADKITLVTDYTIYPGSRLTEVNAKSDKKIENFCTGLAKHENTETIIADNKEGWSYVAIWGKQTLLNENLGIALFFNSKDKLDLTEDSVSRVVVLNARENHIRYYFAACWEKEKKGIKTQRDFQLFLNETVESLNNPIIFEVQ